MSTHSWARFKRARTRNLLRSDDWHSDRPRERQQSWTSSLELSCGFQPRRESPRSRADPAAAELGVSRHPTGSTHLGEDWAGNNSAAGYHAPIPPGDKHPTVSSKPRGRRSRDHDVTRIFESAGKIQSSAETSPSSPCSPGSAVRTPLRMRGAFLRGPPVCMPSRRGQRNS